MAYVRVHKKQRLTHKSKCKWFHWEVIPGSTGREVGYGEGREPVQGALVNRTAQHLDGT